MPRLSFTQVRWITTLYLGGDPRSKLRGQAEHGGANGTYYSLRKLGFLDVDGALTDAGRDECERRLKVKSDKGFKS